MVHRLVGEPGRDRVLASQTARPGTALARNVPGVLVSEQVNVRAGGRVDSLQLLYSGQQGGQHGGQGGQLTRIRLYEV